MYSEKDLKVIHSPYFQIIELNPNIFEVMSKNTRHFWKIIPEQNQVKHLYHKHSSEKNYHYQTSFLTLEDCFLYIADHDDYQLRGRKPAKRKIHSFFDDIVKIYVN